MYQVWGIYKLKRKCARLRIRLRLYKNIVFSLTSYKLFTIDTRMQARYLTAILLFLIVFSLQEYKVNCQGRNCTRLCLAAYRPVCGTDGRTYSNTCLLDVENCRRNLNRQIYVAYYGRCRRITERPIYQV